MITILLALAASTPVDVACAALEEDDKKLKTALAALGTEPNTAPLRGLASLLRGRNLDASNLLDTPGFEAERAMAQKPGRGGLGRARTTLAKAAEQSDATATTLFLAALAFDGAGQSKKAHELLSRAVKKAGALSPAFAPDPAAALPRAVELAGGTASDPALARCLAASGRAASALAVAEDAVGLEVWSRIDEREALRFASRTKDDEGRAAYIELLIRTGNTPKARRLLGEVDDPSRHAAFARAAARFAIDDEEARAAVSLARAAARADPKNDRGVALVVEALLVAKKPDQAAAFADELLRRRPADVDPFALIARVQEARGRTRLVRAERLRSEAFLAGKKRRRAAVERREAIFSAIRDAELSKSATGLAALAREDVTLSLPVDLALARHGKPGTARAARDRILAACSRHLTTFLERRDPWEQLPARLTNYAKPRDVVLQLSAADPARCKRAAPMKAKRRRRRR